jgi:hypothetical protein
MKKVLCSLMVALFMGLSVNSFAQKSVAFINMKTSKKAIDETTAVLSFQLNNVNDEQAKEKFAGSFKSFPGVTEVNASLLGNKVASYAVKMPKKGMAEAMQKMFEAAGIETVNIDGEIVATNELAAYFRKKAAAK